MVGLHKNKHSDFALMPKCIRFAFYAKNAPMFLAPMPQLKWVGYKVTRWRNWAGEGEERNREIPSGCSASGFHFSNPYMGVLVAIPFKWVKGTTPTSQAAHAIK